MTLRPFWYGGMLGYRESSTGETVKLLAPVVLEEEFLGVNIAARWTALDTNGGAEGQSTAGGFLGNGAVELSIANTNEIELAGLYLGDARGFVLSQKPLIEFRFRYSVLPTGAVVSVLGFAGNHNAAVDTVAESIWFRVDGSGTLTVENDDTVHETSKIATGVVLVANQWAIGRIECEDPTHVRFYVNDQRVAAATVFNMNQVPGLLLQPVMRIGKEAAAATVGTLQVDYVRAWQTRA